MTPMEDVPNTSDREIMGWYWWEGHLSASEMEAYLIDDPDMGPYFEPLTELPS